MAVSKGFGAYLILPWLDIPMHFLGGVAIGYFFRASLRNPAAADVLGELTPFAQKLLLIAAVAATTAVWEFAEWTTDSFGLTQSQLGLEDTLLDMLLGIGGGLCIVIEFRHGSA
ncbi:MAG: hypothetical protein GY747_07515 [Planctomycetes bacterium]|nr:hypothetical protein [Planctomycetota bacterium]MCP4771052.1 hypothetical protein [Planctomycetota bacterium]MCP4861931.1 hypothetical protein [Planctomycetota bacterium]